jgi:type IV pilus assembly protein PilE
MEDKDMNHSANSRGFTLIEIMIVVAIIGILVGLAVPKFTKATVKAKQTEAKLLLNQIYVMEQTYREEFDTYWIPPDGIAASANSPDAFAGLGIEIMAQARYTYTITSSGNGFIAQAVATNLDNDESEDRWQIDQNGKLLAMVNDAVK